MACLGRGAVHVGDGDGACREGKAAIMHCGGRRVTSCVCTSGICWEGRVRRVGKGGVECIEEREREREREGCARGHIGEEGVRHIGEGWVMLAGGV